jgi:glycine/D-amino acid oxidase-like deaminating enzyme/bacterioferritin-associated ferredoxin
MRSHATTPQSAAITVNVDGRAVTAYEGETLAAALVGAGLRVGRHTQSGNPRHVFCGMGVCFDCLTIVEGMGTVRACMTKVREGMEVRSWPANGLPAISALPPLGTAPDGPLTRRRCQLAVVGAGPGGLEAAIAAAEAGVHTVILDERPEPGGHYYEQPADSIRAETTGDRRFAKGAALIATARSLGCEILSGATVWRGTCNDGVLELSVLHDGAVSYLQPDHLVIATGAYDEPFPIPGWTRPGVLAVGGVQSLLRGYGVVPDGPVALCGNGPLLLQLASELVRVGVKVSAVVSASTLPLKRLPAVLALLRHSPDLVAEGMRYLATLVLHAVPLISGHVITRVTGTDTVQGVCIAPCDATGRPERTQERAIAARTVCLGYGFLPSNELARQLGCAHAAPAAGVRTVWAQRSVDGQSSLPQVHIVGEAGGIGGARIASCQGRLAGMRVAERLTAVPADRKRISAVICELGRHIAFQNALNGVYDATPDALNIATDDTHICRCEEVTLGALKAAIADGAADMGTLKRLTRAGMGRCQGRYCQSCLAQLLQRELRAPVKADQYFMAQPPLKPLPLRALAVEKPEWGGHKRSSLRPLSDAPVGRDRLGNEEIVIIGAGIAGCSTAYWLGRAGRPALVLDRGPVNGQASGGNAGSMHVQLLSFDFGSKAESGGSPALRTLLLQRESAQMWAQLEKELGGDFEIKTVGGLMMAESEREIGFLQEKAARERAMGIDVTVIGPEELQRLAPAVSTKMRGAAFCPEEGKINPLKGTQGIYRAALALGQRFSTGFEVLHIAREGAGFRIDTPRGWYRAGVVVNAAGAWTSQISGMVGTPVPVHGAPLQMIVTEAIAPTVHHLLAHADRHLTMKQMHNGNFIIGGGWTAGYAGVTGYPTCLRDSLEGNAWVARRIVPALDGAHIIRSWAALNINIDGAPIVGEMPGVPGFYNTVTSNGYTLGPIMGRITSDLITRGNTDWDISAFTLARF